MLVKVFSTQMGERELETSASTWGQLQQDLDDNSISYSKMKAVIGESKLTLEADGAALPTEGFTLFLMNKKTKAGLGKDLSSYKYGELRGTVRFILDQTPSTSDYFNQGKNYTTKSGYVLRELLEFYEGEIPDLDDVNEFLAEAKANKTNNAIKKITVELAEKEEECSETTEGFKEREPAEEVEEEEREEVTLASFSDTFDLEKLDELTGGLAGVNLSELSYEMEESLGGIIGSLSLLSAKGWKIVQERREALAQAAKEAQEKRERIEQLEKELYSLREEFSDVT